MADPRSITITTVSDLTWARSEVLAAVAAGHGVNVFWRHGGATSLVFRVMAGRRLIVIGMGPTSRCETPAAAVDAGFAMLPKTVRDDAAGAIA